MKQIRRKDYIDRLLGLKNTPDIKIITGLRRSGKTKLMEAFIDEIQKEEIGANIIYIDFYDIQFEELKDYKKLNSFILASTKKGVANYLFVDEVQLCPKFELVINSLHNAGKHDIYITGSNAFLLSSDLSTLFTGRFIEIKVYPFSFKEFKQYFPSSDDESLFDQYVIKGGLAGSYAYQNEVDRIAYIHDVYDTIINRDLVLKHGLSDVSVLDRLSEFMMDNVSNIASPNKISNQLNFNKISTNHVTVGRYIKYLCNAFVFYDVKRYDIQGKEYLETADKFYLCDLGFRFAELGTRNMDYGRCYENIVCLELLRRGYEVYVGKLYQKEIDFVATKGGERIYIQVSDDITSADTFQREIMPLLKIRDAYPKMLIARTRHPEYQYEGIRIVNIAEWLLGSAQRINSNH